MAVRGLSEAVSDSQGWSLHKAILLRSVIKLFKLGRLDAWGKKGKMLVFTVVYVCVKAKLTFVSFFPFFLHLSHRKFSRLSVSVVLAKNFTGETGTVEKIKIGR